MQNHFTAFFLPEWNFYRKIEAFRKELWQVIHTVMEGESLKETALQQETDMLDPI